MIWSRVSPMFKKALLPIPVLNGGDSAQPVTITLIVELYP